ncbi:MAG: hypothetical protein WCK29_01810 [archaeon]
MYKSLDNNLVDYLSLAVLALPAIVCSIGINSAIYFFKAKEYLESTNLRGKESGLFNILD